MGQPPNKILFRNVKNKKMNEYRYTHNMNLYFKGIIFEQRKLFSKGDIQYGFIYMTFSERQWR